MTRGSLSTQRRSFGNKLPAQNVYRAWYNINNSSPSTRTSRTVGEAPFGGSMSPMTQCICHLQKRSQATRPQNHNKYGGWLKGIY